ncbi:MAG: hypothetical protein K0B10_15620 [Vicingaceae bacterium]|nr:hypothetical protein [Vicingaceae bacterium]
MDTDELSNETYEAILIEAEKFNHNLTLQFGLLSYECSNEQEYIEKSIELVRKLKNTNKGKLNNVFFGESFNHQEFIDTLDRISQNIERINEIPLEKRTFEF